MLPAREKSITKNLEDCRLIMQRSGMYAVFQSQLLRSESWVPGVADTQLYTYGKITGHGWHLTRTDREEKTDKIGRLIPEHEGQLDTQLHLGLLVLHEEEVETAIDTLGDRTHLEDWPPCTLPAERLFRGLSGKNICVGGVAVEACGTYREDSSGTRLVVVHDSGGMSIGLGSREGIATALDLIEPAPALIPAR